jgi:hypothetical protein
MSMTVTCSLGCALRAAHSRIDHTNPLSFAICTLLLVGKEKKAKMIREFPCLT